MLELLYIAKIGLTDDDEVKILARTQWTLVSPYRTVLELTYSRSNDPYFECQLKLQN